MPARMLYNRSLKSNIKNVSKFSEIEENDTAFDKFPSASSRVQRHVTRKFSSQRVNIYVHLYVCIYIYIYIYCRQVDGIRCGAPITRLFGKSLCCCNNARAAAFNLAIWPRGIKPNFQSNERLFAINSC